MEIRNLHGMTYRSIEVSHDVIEPVHKVLRMIAHYLEVEGVNHGLLTSITTASDPYDEDRFLTTLVWAD